MKIKTPIFKIFGENLIFKGESQFLFWDLSLLKEKCTINVAQQTQPFFSFFGNVLAYIERDEWGDSVVSCNKNTGGRSQPFMPFKDHRQITDLDLHQTTLVCQSGGCFIIKDMENNTYRELDFDDRCVLLYRLRITNFQIFHAHNRLIINTVYFIDANEYLITVIDLQSHQTLLAEDHVLLWAFHNENKLLATVSRGKGGILIWDIITGLCLKILNQKEVISSAYAKIVFDANILYVNKTFPNTVDSYQF